MTQKLKMTRIQDATLTTIREFFEKYTNQIQQAYDNGGNEVKIAFAVSVKMDKRGNIEHSTEINFVKTRIKDKSQRSYDPDQIMLDFEVGANNTFEPPTEPYP
jgi:hypothetical protein